VRIAIDNTNATLLDKDGYMLVYDFLSFRPEGFQFVTAYKRKHWDGWKHILSPGSGKFPAGLAPAVSRLLRDNGFEVEVIDNRVRPEMHQLLSSLKLTHELEPHQYHASMAVADRGRGVVHHPVGSGKSVVIVDAARRIAVPTLVVVQSQELLYQQAEQFTEFLGRRDIVGIVGDGVWEPSLYTVATIQTLNAKMRDLMGTKWMLEWLKQWQAVFVDECHHLPAASYEKLMQRVPNAYFRVGFSATPHRSGKKEQELMVTGMTGDIISQQGFIESRQVPADVFVVPPGGYLPDKNATYPDEVEAGIIRNEVRNELIGKAGEAFGKMGPTLILTERIEHGQRLHDWFAEQGWEELR
jgi:hypothetical protein